MNHAHPYWPKLEAALSDTSGIIVPQGEDEGAYFERLRSSIREHATGAEMVSATVAAPVAQVAPQAVGLWLIGTSGAVFGMVVVGGITRLTRSGLSMTDWRPQGKRWPRDEAEWLAEFEQYKRFPEYQRQLCSERQKLCESPWWWCSLH